MDHTGKILVNDAPTQFDRWLSAFDPVLAPVDGRNFADMLEFVRRFSALVRFWDAQDKPDGNWSAFFETDSVLLLASIQAADLTSWRSRFESDEKELAQAHRGQRRRAAFLRLFRDLIRLALRYDAWMVSLGRVNPRSVSARRMYDAMAYLVEDRLGDGLRAVFGCGLAAAQHGGLGASYKVLPRYLRWVLPRFSPLWGLSQVYPDVSAYGAGSERTRLTTAAALVGGAFSDFIFAIEGLKPEAAQGVETALSERDHPPHLALVMAFIRLFSHAQDALNQFAERLMSFYYDRVLQEQPAGAVGDQVYLTFTLDPKSGQSAALVPRGTPFAAGQDANGGDILFATQKDFTVQGSALTQIRTIRTVTGPLVIAATDAPVPPRVIQSVIQSEIDPTADALKDGGWWMFGPPSPGKSGCETSRPALLGFAVASPLLALTGGARTVTLSFTLDPQKPDQQALTASLDYLSQATGRSMQDVLEIILQDGFEFYISVTQGWLKVDHVTATATVDGTAVTGFTLVITLDANAPPLAAIDPLAKPDDKGPKVSQDADIAGSNPVPGWPGIKAYVRTLPLEMSNGVSVQPLAVLSTLYPQSRTVKVKVSDLSVPLLSNSDGQIDPTTPFAILGGVPVVGSYLDIHVPELFLKKPSDLSVTVNWFGLPQNLSGFTAYYQQYVLGLDGQPLATPISNDSFQWQAQVCNPGLWTLDGGNLTMFALDATFHLLPTSRFDLSPTENRPVPAYYDPTQSTLRFSLTKPSYAFGNDIYAKNVLNAVIKDLPVAYIPTPPQGDGATSAPQQSQPQQQQQANALGGDQDHGANGAALADSAAVCALQCGALAEAAAYLDGKTAPSDDDLAQVSRDLRAAFIDLLLSGLKWSTKPADLKTLDRLRGAPATVLAQVVDQCAKDLGPVYRGRVDRCRTLVEGINAVDWRRVHPAPTEDHLPKILRKLYGECMATAPQDAAEEDPSKQEPATPQTASPEDPVKQPDPNPGTVPSDPLPVSPPPDPVVDPVVPPLMPDPVVIPVPVLTPDPVPVKELSYPNQPWMPMASAVVLGYGASVEQGAEARFFDLLAFGGWVPSGAALVSSPGTAAADSGQLCLGFDSLPTGVDLALLMRMAADGDGATPDPAWSRLNGDVWMPLTPQQVRSDQTGGLRNTGILTLNTGSQTVAETSTLFPGGAQWLRARVATDPDGFPSMLGIYANATLAAWVDNGAGAARQGTPLPPGTIQKAAVQLPAIDQIGQPMESFGGRPPEDRRAFTIRLSERLRHKDRAVLGWDYERLVLENYPSLWMAKTLPLIDPAHPGQHPGSVAVAVIPGADAVGGIDPAMPAVGPDTLEQIAEFLRAKASCWANLHVVNPVYVAITVKVEVNFAEDEDTGACIKRLNDDLHGWLSPWYYDAARAATQGAYASEDDILEFIQTRPYVEGVVRCAFSYSPDPAALDWYCLTSAPQHQIAEAVGGPSLRGAAAKGAVRRRQEVGHG